jgi:hypothetical protein
MTACTSNKPAFRIQRKLHFMLQWLQWLWSTCVQYAMKVAA